MKVRNGFNSLCIIIILVLPCFGLFSSVPRPAAAWSNGGYSDNPDAPLYGTHDYIAEHALDFIDSELVRFLHVYKTDFLYGTELPDNANAEGGYGDTTLHHVYYDRNGKVIGVVQDFNFLSLHEAVAPLVISLDTLPLEYDVTWLYIKVQHGKNAEAVRFVKQTLKKFGVDDPMDHFFLEDRLEKAYRDEEKLGTIFGFFSIICILISCLGLLGLSSFVTEQRTKEIGIRKVVGARISNIIILLSKDFLILVLIANIIAWPIAAYVMSKWLENFAFRIEIGLSTFVLAALAAFIIAFLTVGFQAFKAASGNPVEALRYE